MTTVLDRTFLLRRDLAVNWESSNPVLRDGEQGYAKDTNLLKVGNGVDGWNALPGISGTGAGLDLGAVTNITYNGTDQVIGYTRDGVVHVVTYPDPAHIVDAGGGVTTTLTLDGAGLVVSVETDSPSNEVSSLTYNGANQVIGYVRAGIVHVVSYPDATHIVDLGGGVTRTVTLDGSGRVSSVVLT